MAGITTAFINYIVHPVRMTRDYRKFTYITGIISSRNVNSDNNNIPLETTRNCTNLQSLRQISLRKNYLDSFYGLVIRVSGC
jgi:hypothetical protein